jgi:hypothetical protein
MHCFGMPLSISSPKLPTHVTPLAFLRDAVIFGHVLLTFCISRRNQFGFGTEHLKNDIRGVIKTTKQSLASKQSVGYVDAVRIILAADGFRGLFGRGLRTRILANALQSIMFTIIWRGLAERWKRKSTSEE